MKTEEFERQLDAAIADREIAEAEHKKTGERLSQTGKKIQHLLGELGEIDGRLIVGKYAVVEVDDLLFRFGKKARKVMLVKNFELSPGSGTMPVNP